MDGVPRPGAVSIAGAKADEVLVRVLASEPDERGRVMSAHDRMPGTGAVNLQSSDAVDGLQVGGCRRQYSRAEASAKAQGEHGIKSPLLVARRQP